MSGSGSPITQITLKQLLNSHLHIEIPLIQRDYAQGRPTVKDIREEFLNTLQQAFMLDPNDNALPLNLDFIYGSSVGKSEKSDSPTCFQPLDGQQRLTTLFLLHWYLAWRDDCQTEFCEVFCEGKEGKEGKSKKAAARTGAPTIRWKGNLGHVSIDNDWSAIAVRPGKTPFFEVRQRATRPSAQARARASTVRR